MEPKDVKEAVRFDIKHVKKLTREEAANLLEMNNPQILSNLLSQQRYFARKMALRFHEKLGYSVAFLMCGEGELFDNEPVTTAVDVARMVRDDLESQGFKLADAARKIKKSPQNFHNMIRGNNRFSRKTAQLLHDEYGYSIRFLTEGKGSLYENEKEEYETLIPEPTDVNEELNFYKRLCASQNETIQILLSRLENK